MADHTAITFVLQQVATRHTLLHCPRLELRELIIQLGVAPDFEWFSLEAGLAVLPLELPETF